MLEQVGSVSDKQRQLMAHATSSRTSIFAGGAIRSGKTFGVILGYCLWMLKSMSKADHAILGVSIEAAMRNVGNTMLEVLQDLGVPAYVSKSLGTRIIAPYKGRDINIWVFSAADERSFKRIQGATLGGLLMDEVVLFPESLFNQAWGRLSVEGSKLWATFNPENPTHWVKKKVIDRAQQYDGTVLKFGLDDNPSLPESVKERYRNSYTGHFYNRLIEGDWAGASGLIFPYWQSGEDFEHYQTTYSLDWGSASVFCCLDVHSHRRQAFVARELYYDARESIPRTEQQHLDALKAWADEGVGLRGQRMYVDPNTPASFKRLVRNEGCVVMNADASVLPGIVTTSSRLQKGEVTIGDCPNLKQELGGYMWDAKASDMGEDKPIKKDDHAVDCLRYYSFNTGKIGRIIQPTRVRQSMRLH